MPTIVFFWSVFCTASNAALHEEEDSARTGEIIESEAAIGNAVSIKGSIFIVTLEKCLPLVDIHTVLEGRFTTTTKPDNVIFTNTQGKAIGDGNLAQRL